MPTPEIKPAGVQIDFTLINSPWWMGEGSAVAHPSLRSSRQLTVAKEESLGSGAAGNLSLLR